MVVGGARGRGLFRDPIPPKLGGRAGGPWFRGGPQAVTKCAASTFTWLKDTDGAGNEVIEDACL